MRQAVGVRVGYFVKYSARRKTEGRVLALVRRKKGRMQIWNVWVNVNGRVEELGHTGIESVEEGGVEEGDVELLNLFVKDLVKREYPNSASPPAKRTRHKPDRFTDTHEHDESENLQAQNEANLTAQTIIETDLKAHTNALNACKKKAAKEANEFKKKAAKEAKAAKMAHDRQTQLLVDARHAFEKKEQELKELSAQLDDLRNVDLKGKKANASKRELPVEEETKKRKKNKKSERNNNKRERETDKTHNNNTKKQEREKKKKTTKQNKREREIKKKTHKTKHNKQKTKASKQNELATYRSRSRSRSRSRNCSRSRSRNSRNSRQDTPDTGHFGLEYIRQLAYLQQLQK